LFNLVGKKLLKEQDWLTRVEDMNGEKTTRGCGVATHDSCARGPGFDATQDSISEAPVSLLSDNRLNKNDVILWCQVEINNLMKFLTPTPTSQIMNYNNNGIDEQRF
jgi:hypothetical protein